jgi:pectin methylesterase-like acyl-CoA thioesterase
VIGGQENRVVGNAARGPEGVVMIAGTAATMIGGRHSVVAVLLLLLASVQLPTAGHAADAPSSANGLVLSHWRFSPANGESGAYPDAELAIVFDAAPVLGITGKINVYRASDGALVDSVDVSDAPVAASGETQTAVPRTNTEIDAISRAVTTIGGRSRWVYYTPVRIGGSQATIKLHDGKLDYDTRYYVTVDPGVLVGSIRGVPFAGVSSPSAWTFTTRSAPSSYTDVSVGNLGRTDFRSIQGALNWIMEHCASGASAAYACNTVATEKRVRIAPGVFHELLFLRNVDNISLTGTDRLLSYAQYENFENYNPGTGGSSVAAMTTMSDEGTGTRLRLGGGRAVLLVEGGDLVRLSRFTLRNTHVKVAGVNNQAETMYFNSASPAGSRFVASYMNFISTQDTVQTKGWAWFYRSLIAGDVDFIWGSPFAAVFEQSELRTVADTVKPTSGGYIIQSRAYFGYPGFVVLDSWLTREWTVPDGATWLARSAGVGNNGFCSEKYTSGSATNIHLLCDNVAYIRTRMGGHIAPQGWLLAPLPNLPPTATTGWRESGSEDPWGRPLDLSGRDTTNASSSVDLSSVDTRAKVFASWNNNTGWVPAPQ